MVPFYKQWVEACPKVGRGHFQIIIKLMQGPPSVVKVKVFVGTEIKVLKLSRSWLLLP